MDSVLPAVPSISSVGGSDYAVKWRRTLLLAIPFGALAFIFGWFLEHPSGQVTTLDLVGYPIMAVALLVLEAVLAYSYRTLRLVVLGIISGSSLFFISKLVYILFMAPSTVNPQAQVTETFFWIPVIYLLSFVLPDVRNGRGIAICFTTLVLVLSGFYAIPQALQGEAWGMIYALVQLNLANTVFLALTSAFISFKEQHTRTQARMETAERFAYVDALTELPNRLSLQEKLRMCIDQAEQQNTKLALLFIDIDGFKVVNDTLGHEAGDHLLKQLAVRLRNLVRKDDFIARISGDEFVLIAEGSETVQAAYFIAQKLQAAMVIPFHVAEQSINVTASIGISVFPDDATDVDSLLRHADSAMYRVKRSGKNGIQHYRGEADSHLEKQRELERDLRLAVNSGQLSLMYQPLHNLVSGKFTKLEALVRWHHPTRGQVPPSDFIPIAEQSGLIVPLGTWVLNEACRQTKEWQLAGATDFKISVNVSPLQFSHPNFFNTVVQALETHRLLPEYLELELTEGIVMHGVDHVTTTLSRLQRLGVRIAIDDFGTGYSSLAYLRDLPIDTVKIDRSFVKDLGSPRSAPQFALALIEAIMSLADYLDIEVVAEGIETQTQCELLKSLGCHIGQGYYFSKPLTASDLARYFSTSQSNSSTTILTTLN